MTDLTVFRVYEPHELKNGRYPFAWDHLTCPDCHGSGEIGFNPSPINDPQCADSARCGTCAGDGALDHGIKDLVREEAGHRCIRCGHPYRVGQPAIWEAIPEFDGSSAARSVLQLAEAGELPEAVKARARRAMHWSPCDEHCTHRGPFRYRQGEGWEWDVVDGPDAEEDWIAMAGDGVTVGHDVQAAWRILTVHHLNERKFDCRWHNLVALCQRCHLEIQNKVEMYQVWPLEHSDWFKPYAAAFYAYSYLGQELTREQTMERLDELLGLERVA